MHNTIVIVEDISPQTYFTSFCRFNNLLSDCSRFRNETVFEDTSLKTNSISAWCSGQSNPLFSNCKVNSSIAVSTSERRIYQKSIHDVLAVHRDLLCKGGSKNEAENDCWQYTS